jgi:hypothetical protein
VQKSELAQVIAGVLCSEGHRHYEPPEAVAERIADRIMQEYVLIHRTVNFDPARRGFSTGLSGSPKPIPPVTAVDSSSAPVAPAAPGTEKKSP